MGDGVIVAALDGLAARGVRLRARAGQLEVQAPEAARGARLDAWLRKHRDELIETACGQCGSIAFAGYSGGGEQRCQACMPARCRGCFAEIPAVATICAACSTSPAVIAAIAAGARQAVP